MAIFASELMANGAVPFRATTEGGVGQFTAKIKIPAGTTLTDGDFIKVARLAPNLQISKVHLRSDDLDSGGIAALAASLGYMRAVQKPYEAYNASTNPAVTGSISADDTDFFLAAGALVLRAGGYAYYAADELANTTLIDGLSDIAFEVTTTSAGAVAADSFITVTVEYVGEVRTPGEFSGTTAYNYTETFYT